jgi:outer membrane receptor protein involved in Fe transport
MNLQLQGDLGRGWNALLRISNLFDRRYATAAALAENPFNSSGGFQTNSDNWSRETFLAPGAPRALWLGLSHRFDAR